MYNTFKDIPKFPTANKRTNIIFPDLKRWFEEHNVNMDPPYQRGYVWTQEQKERYIEFIFRGGESGKDIYINAPSWIDDCKDEDQEWANGIELVDGKQRVTAIIEFVDNKVKLFGKYLNEYRHWEGDKPAILGFRYDVLIHINTLQTKEEVVKWYLDLNSGGTIHTDNDLAIAKEYLEKVKK